MERERKPKRRSWFKLLTSPQARWVLISRWFGQKPTPASETWFPTRWLVRHSYRTAFQDYLINRPRLEQIHQVSTFERNMFPPTMNPYFAAANPPQIPPVSRSTVAAYAHMVLSPLKNKKIVAVIPDQSQITELQRQGLEFEKEVQLFKKVKQESAMLHVKYPYIVKPSAFPYMLQATLYGLTFFGIWYIHFAYLTPWLLKIRDYYPRNYYELRQLDRDYDAWATFNIQKRIRKEERKERYARWWNWLWYSGKVDPSAPRPDDGPGYQNKYGL